MNTKNWILVLVLLLALSFSIPSLRKKIPISGHTIGTNPDLDFKKGVKLKEIKRYIESSESFTPEECKQLLKEWQPDIDELEFRNMGIADQASVDIPDGKRYITLIYRDDDSFEGCNVLDVFDTDLEKKESEIER